MPRYFIVFEPAPTAAELRADSSSLPLDFRTTKTETIADTPSLEAQDQQPDNEASISLSPTRNNQQSSVVEHAPELDAEHEIATLLPPASQFISSTSNDCMQESAAIEASYIQGASVSMPQFAFQTSSLTTLRDCFELQREIDAGAGKVSVDLLAVILSVEPLKEIETKGGRKMQMLSMELGDDTGRKLPISALYLEAVNCLCLICCY